MIAYILFIVAAVLLYLFFTLIEKTEVWEMDEDIFISQAKYYVEIKNCENPDEAEQAFIAGAIFMLPYVDIKWRTKELERIHNEIYGGENEN